MPIAPARRNLALGLLTLIFMSSYLDRQILSVLLPQIKAEFALADGQLGVLTGLAFALFYVGLGVPLARIADRGSRVTLLSICIAVWSLFTAACGLATGFWTLLVARIGVGVGEAGCNPSAASLISGHFPLETRATANAIYSTAIPLASLLALAGGGWIAENLGWRSAFVIVGLPGLILAVLARLLIADVGRKATIGSPQSVVEPDFGFAAAMGYLFSTRSFLLMAFAAAAESFAGFGIMIWLPSYLVRSFDYGVGQAGLLLGVATGALGFVGILVAGVVGDRLGRADRRWNCLLPACVMTIVPIFQVSAFFASSPIAMIAIMIIPLAALGSSAGPINAAAQAVVPVRLRATCAAIFGLILNLIGYGLGPTFVGVVSDRLTPALGQDALRAALVLACVGYWVAAILYFLASRRLVADIARAESAPSAASPERRAAPTDPQPSV